jgi:hypothetical protein
MDHLNLPVKLTNDELLIRSNELAEQVQELAAIEYRKKLANNAFKEEIEKTEESVGQLARIVKDREEYRDVEVREVKNMERLTMDTVRLDTGEVVSYRDLKGHERNLDLFPRKAEQVN